MLTKADWEDRYQRGETPWEKGAGAPGLVDFLRRHPDLPRGAVVVPGCGTGHDARTWARHGFDTLGVDLAPSAIRRAEDHPESPGLRARFLVADFLRDPPAQRFDWLFEHTLFCAIDPSERDLYGQAVRRWLAPGGHFLALHYMLREGDGPPFGCTQEELMERFAGDFQLVEGWIPPSYPNRAGLELMLWWRRREPAAEPAAPPTP